MLDDLLGGLVGGMIGGSLAGRRARKRAGRLEAKARTEVSLRVVRGSVPGLRSSWLHGVGTLSPGSLEFTSCVGGLRFLRRRPVTVPVTGVDLTSHRTPVGVEHLRVNAGVIVGVSSGEAALELALLDPHRLTWVLGELGLR